MENQIAWHLQPGNKEIQIKKVMTSVQSVINGETKKLSIGSQGFAQDERAAHEFANIITAELDKLGCEGLHEIHQSKTGSGNWYYNLRGFWQKGSSNIFDNFQQAAAFARNSGGKIQRLGNGWQVSK